jgi:hypothetical protein
LVRPSLDCHAAFVGLLGCPAGLRIHVGLGRGL